MSLETIGITCLLVGAVITEARRSWHHGEFSTSSSNPRALGRRLLSWLPTVLMLAGAAIYFYAESSESEGFNGGWPAAISCSWQAPGEEFPGQWILFYRGHAVRPSVGTVELYAVLGNPPVQQSFHEMWFKDDDHAMVTPKMVGDPAYRNVFLNGKLDCGGNRIEEIEKSGHAFVMSKMHAGDWP